MITTFLVEHRWVTTAALAGSVLVGPLVGAWLVGRARLTRALLALSLLAVLLLTLVPTSRDLTAGCTAEWDFPTLGAVELMANVVLLVPVALLAGVLTRRPLVVLLAASGLSALVEVVQALVPALGRSCSTNDWLSNSLGALLGSVLALVALRIAGSRLGRPEPARVDA